MPKDVNRCVVPADVAGDRLDRYLADLLGESRSRVQQWVKAGLVTVGGARAKPSRILAEGELLEWSAPAPLASDRLEPEEGEIVVLYEDAHLAAIEKPAGIAVHPGAGRRTGTLAHRFLARWPHIEEVGSTARPGIVHRLDLDTTGVLLVALSQKAYRGLTQAFAERAVEKAYRGIVWGSPRPAAGAVRKPIGRHRKERKKMTVRPDGRPAHTEYRVAAAAAGTSYLELEIRTGRTHQIRVHLKAIGHPLVGDPIYGEARWRTAPVTVRRTLREFPRPALHAAELALQHPVSGRLLRLRAPLAEDLRRLWRDLGGDPDSLS